MFLVDTDKTQRILYPLSAGSVTWTGENRQVVDLIIKRQFREDWLKKLEEQFQPGIDDGDNGWRGEYWGKLMRGACYIYAATGDEGLYTVLENSVRGLLTRQDALGRIASYSTAKEFQGWDMWGRKYVMLGCLYFLDICKDDTLRTQVLEALKRHADYIVEHIGPGEGQIDILDTSHAWGTVNSCSILEPMVRLYELTNEKRYLDFAEYIIDIGGAVGENIFEKAYRREEYPYQYKTTKAYEMMSCFEGLLEYALVTGNEKWKQAVINFVDQVGESEITIVGTGGCTHELFDHSAVRQFDVNERGVMLETCVTVTWMKLCMRMLSVTGDSRYAAYVERAYFNSMLGAVNTDYRPENGGLTFDSYSPLINNQRARGIGGLKNVHCLWFSSCCDSIGAVGIGVGLLSAYMADSEGLVINSCMPATVSYAYNGHQMKWTVDSVYPNPGTIRLCVETADSCKMAVKLRIPTYSRHTTVTVNGETCSTDGDYVIITREWKNGDEIVLTLDMDVREITPADYGVENSSLVAYEVGPLVLARDKRFGDDMEQPLAADVISIKSEENKAFFSNVCYVLEQADGKEIRLAEYKACGKTWNEESNTTVWMSIKK